MFISINKLGTIDFVFKLDSPSKFTVDTKQLLSLDDYKNMRSAGNY